MQQLQYKGVLLICIAAKLYKTKIDKRFKLQTENRLLNEQNWSKKNYRIEDHTLTLQ